MRGTHAFALGALALVVSSLVALASQTPAPPQPEPQPTFRTEANYVRVDAYPTHDGEPVLDLKQEDFEVIEGNAPQKVEQFEHVMIHAATPQDVRIEPNSVRESMAMVANSRARVFVIFLDIGHVDVDGSRRIRAPLVKALDSLIGPEDLVAVMTPEMSPSDITFARKTTTIEGFLARHWNWGERDQISTVDAQEQLYKECYPGALPVQCPDNTTDDDRGVADEMIARRREKMTIDALSNLVTYLRGVREERKAVLAISDGWLLFKPNPGLARKLNCQVPGLPNPGFDPRTGRLSAGGQPDPITGINPASCDRDRLMLSALDDDQEFRTLLDQANRANTSFYPVDPRGLVVFDTSIAMPTTGAPPPGSTTITPPSVDQAMLTSRLYSLRTLAEATDGLAIVNSNDLDRGFKRVVERPVVLLPARLLLDGKAGRKIPFDHRPRKASWRAGARATRLSGCHRCECGNLRARRRRGEIGRDAGGGCRCCCQSRGRGFDCAALRIRARRAAAPSDDRGLEARGHIVSVDVAGR